MIENKRLRCTIVQWRTCQTAIKLVYLATKQFTILGVVSEMCFQDQTVVLGDDPLLFAMDTTGSFMSTLHITRLE